MIIINNSKSHLGRFFWLFLLSCFISVCVNAQHTTEFEFTDAPQAMLKSMQNNVGSVFGSIHQSYFGKKTGLELLEKHATKKAIEQIRTLWSTSHFYCTETDVIQPVVKSSDGYEVRNIPVFFKEGKTSEDQYQDLVIEFASDGRINDMFITLPMHQIDKFFENASDVTDFRLRQLVVDFVENFRAAYNRKDISFLDAVFNNDALIIIGSERKVQSSKGNDALIPNRSTSDIKNETTVDYVRRTKSEYMENLKKAFAANEFINIKFSDIEIMQRSAGSPIYGVTLRQVWNSSNYSDVGWLFLMIDFANEEKPQIWVRTWQPISVERRRVFGLDDFSM